MIRLAINTIIMNIVAIPLAAVLKHLPIPIPGWALSVAGSWPDAVLIGAAVMGQIRVPNTLLLLTGLVGPELAISRHGAALYFQACALANLGASVGWGGTAYAGFIWGTDSQHYAGDSIVFSFNLNQLPESSRNTIVKNFSGRNNIRGFWRSFQAANPNKMVAIEEQILAGGGSLSSSTRAWGIIASSFPGNFISQPVTLGFGLTGAVDFAVTIVSSGTKSMTSAWFSAGAQRDWQILPLKDKPVPFGLAH